MIHGQVIAAAAQRGVETAGHRREGAFEGGRNVLSKHLVCDHERQSEEKWKHLEINHYKGPLEFDFLHVFIVIVSISLLQTSVARFNDHCFVFVY